MRCLALLLLYSFSIAPLYAQETLRNNSRECAICHIRWVDALAPQNKQMASMLERQAGSGDMCLSCHDGSVADSRFKVWSTHHHTTGTKPSQAVDIPTDIFPLNDQGHMTCATCHTAHAVPGSSDLKTVIFLRQPNVDSSLCLACHPGQAQKNHFQHPLGTLNSKIPEEIITAGGKTAADGKTMICQTCHEPHGARHDWMLVLPPSELCIACHTEQSHNTIQETDIPVHHIGHTYPGFKPPDSLRKAKASFGPNHELTCLSCHRLHDASGARPLLIQDNSNSALCLECHPSEAFVLNTPHDFSHSPSVTNAADEDNFHTSGPCSACHHSHGWARSVPTSPFPNSAGCLECHQTEGPGASQHPYHAAHPMGMAVSKDIAIGLPLVPETREMGCITCHNPHSVNTTGSFLRYPINKLCIQCHNEKRTALRGPHNSQTWRDQHRQRLNVDASSAACQVCHEIHGETLTHTCISCHSDQETLAQGPHNVSNWPTAIRHKLGIENSTHLCQACHDPHGERPTRTCTDCHNDDIAPRPKLTMHGPSDISSQCQLCHDPHKAATSPAQLRHPKESLCLTCHEDKAKISGSIHDPHNLYKSQDSEHKPQGLCLDCHPIHQARHESPLFQSIDTSTEETSCAICHRENGPALAVETPHLNHPSQATDNKEMTCTSCHNIHQPDANTPYLQKENSGSSTCLTCHEHSKSILGTSHDLRETAPHTLNPLGKTAQQAGPCAACHQIHSPSPPCLVPHVITKMAQRQSMFLIS